MAGAATVSGMSSPSIPDAARRPDHDAVTKRLRVPLVAAPMLHISSARLVIEACRNGIIGAFPALNAATTAEFGEWLDTIERELAEVPGAAPFAVNLITHPTNRRLNADLALVLVHKVPIVITSVGAPERVMADVHAYGGIVLSDVSSIRHARKAAACGVDGMVLLCAGAGGQTGRLNPFAFIEAVRAFYDGLIVVSGGITNGRQLAALELLGADLGYAGTAFITADESHADADYRSTLIASSADDVLETDAFTGIPVNLVESSALRFGITQANRWRQQGANYDTANVRWRDGLITAGHGVGSITASRSCAEIVDAFAKGYSVFRHDRHELRERRKR